MEIKQVKAIILNQLGVRLIDYGTFYKSQLDEDYGDSFEIYVRDKFSLSEFFHFHFISISTKVGETSMELTQEVFHEQDLYDLINKFKLLAKTLKGE